MDQSLVVANATTETKDFIGKLRGSNVTLLACRKCLGLIYLKQKYKNW